VDHYFRSTRTVGHSYLQRFGGVGEHANVLECPLPADRAGSPDVREYSLTRLVCIMTGQCQADIHIRSHRNIRRYGVRYRLPGRTVGQMGNRKVAGRVAFQLHPIWRRNPSFVRTVTGSIRSRAPL